MIKDEDIRRQLRLGEDSRWEFKRIEFSGNTPTSPRGNGLADKLGAFANADGGIVLCGVTDDGTIQGMSREQMVALDHLLADQRPRAVIAHRRPSQGTGWQGIRATGRKRPARS